MKLIRALLCAFLLTIIGMPIIALASDITGAKFYGVIVVSNNSTATSNVATTANISSQVLIDGSHMNASGNNTAIRNAAGADVPFMPGYNATPWVMWVPSIGANSYLNYILYTDNSTGGNIAYFPDDAGMSANDGDTLELGDNFTIEQKGWWDTTAVNATSVNKPGAFRTIISATSNITSQVYPPVTDIDIGAAASNRAASSTGNVTYISLDNSANGTGVISTVEIWANSSISGIRVGTFYTTVNSTTLRCRDSQTIGSVTGGSKQTFSGLAIDVVVGDYIGCYFVGGQIEVDSAGFAGRYYLAGEHIDPGDEETYTLIANSAQSLYGIGTSPIEVTATAISSGNHTVKTVRERDIWLEFNDDESDSISCGDSASIKSTFGTGNFTCELWFKTTDVPATDCEVVSRYPASRRFKAGTLSTGNFFAYLTDGSNSLNAITTGLSLLDGEWHHVVIVRDKASAKLILYIDSIEEVSPNDTTDNLTADGNFLLAHGVSHAYYGGSLDEVRLYSRALDQSEVEYNFNQGRIGSPQPYSTANLTIWLHMDEASGTTVDDETANSNNGTITGADWQNESLKIYVDGVLKDTSANATVTDNSENWTFCSGGSMPYLEYQKIWIGDTLRQHIIWEYNASVFTDLSGNGNDVTPTFRTTSSNENVTANLTRFLPIAEAKAPAYTLSEAPPFITETPEIVAPFTTTPPEVTFPLQGVIAAIAEASGTPAQLPLLIIAGFIIVAISLSFSAFLRRYGSGSIFVKIIVITALMGVFLAIRGFGIDLWMIVIFLIIASGVAMASRPQGVT